MCGLIGFIGRKDANRELARDFLLDQYDEQNGRGNRGFGLIRSDENTLQVRRSTLEIKALMDINNIKENVLFFHHRAPTSTPNYQDQTHPFLVKHDELKNDWLVMHNGVITNAHELIKYHQNELGYAYTSYYEAESKYGYAAKMQHFNDSESFAIELARYLEELTKEIDTRGAVAFLAIRLNKTTGLAEEYYWGRNDLHSPLVLDETPEGIIIASELPAGDDIIDNIVESLEAKYLYAKNPPKELRNKIKPRALFFKEYAVVNTTVPVKTIPVGFTQQTTSFKKEETEEDEIEVLGKDTPEGYTDREWALYKMITRNIPKITELLTDLFENTAYSDPKETQEEYMCFAKEFQEIMGDLLVRAETIKNIFEKKETDEAEQDALEDTKQYNQDNPLNHLSDYGLDPSDYDDSDLSHGKTNHYHARYGLS